MPLTKHEFLEAIIEAVEEGKEIKLETRVCEASRAYITVTAKGLDLIYQIPLSTCIPDNIEKWIGDIELHDTEGQVWQAAQMYTRLQQFAAEIREREILARQREAKLLYEEFKVTLQELGYAADERNRITRIEKSTEPKTWHGLLDYFIGLLSNGKK